MKCLRNTDMFYNSCKTLNGVPSKVRLLRTSWVTVATVAKTVGIRSHCRQDGGRSASDDRFRVDLRTAIAPRSWRAWLRALALAKKSRIHN